MNIITADNLVKTYGEKVLLNNVNLGISRGDKLALVAANGAGKSTLLKIISGEDKAREGKVSVRQGIRIGYLPQDPIIEGSGKVLEYIETAGGAVREVISRYKKALETDISTHSTESSKTLETLNAEMDMFQAWDYEARLGRLLHRFNIIDYNQKISTLSGGQKKRLALAILLLDNPDVMLLDEPTNHLDIEMIEWLEDHLSKSNATFLLVTHDRYFLDRTCNGILELSRGNIYQYKGGYSYFLEKKEQRELAENAEIEKSGNLLRNELEWIRRMPKARTSKSKSRIDAFYSLKEKAESGVRKKDLKLDVGMNRLGSKILDVKEITKSFDGKTILKKFSYSFLRGEKIGIIGGNGTGKTTFLKLLSGHLNPDSGEIEKGETVVMSFFKQEGMKLPEDKRVIDVVKDISEIIQFNDGTIISASQFLQQFLFPNDLQYSLVSKLSGGEKKRLYLLTVLMKMPNFLILDEPTNDLDILTLNKLEEFLSNFNGCLILVTHDRFFLDKLAETVFVFEGDGKITTFSGNYSEYQLFREKNSPIIERTIPAERIQRSTGISDKTKPSFRQKQDYIKLGMEIEQLEIAKADLILQMNDSGSDFEKLNRISLQITRIMKEIDEKSMKWLELDEICSGK